MTTPKTKLLVSGIAIVLGLVAWRFFHNNASLAQNSGPSSVEVANQTKPSNPSTAPTQPLAAFPEARSTARPSIVDQRGSILTNGKPFEQVSIQYWAEIYGFEITNEELTQAQQAYLATLQARRKLEDALATVERINPSHFKIVIPAYTEKGQQLLTQFGSSLATILGSDRASQFMDKIKVRLDRENFGWGMVDQVLDVTLRRESSLETMEISHGFALPDSGSFSAITGVSNSKLSPDDLDIYSYLGHHFPKQSAN